jgi:hypothetical protein
MGYRVLWYYVEVRGGILEVGHITDISYMYYIIISELKVPSGQIGSA